MLIRGIGCATTDSYLADFSKYTHQSALNDPIDRLRVADSRVPFHISGEAIEYNSVIIDEELLDTLTFILPIVLWPSGLPF